MVKYLVGLLVLVIVVLGVVLLVREDPGFVLLRYRDYSVETTLAFALAAVILAAVAFYCAVKILRGLLRLPGAMKRQSQNRRFNKARKLLNQGLIDLAEGRFEQAENNLVRLVEFSESPLVHYLGAARAAQLQGKYDARDNYLKAAHETNPDAALAIGVTQAELQLAHRQNEQALATLSHLRGLAPRHDYVLMLLARAYHELEDWTELVKLLPDLRRKKLLDEQRLREMELAGYQGVMENAGDDQAGFEKAWKAVPRALQTDPKMIGFYLETLIRRSWRIDGAEQLAIRVLEQRWDDELIEIYGRFAAGDANTQLARAERWLDEFGHNENLLLALGRIAMRARLWGKANGYFEASIGARATPAACLALAELFEKQLQQPAKAVAYYQRGLRLCLERQS